VTPASRPRTCAAPPQGYLAAGISLLALVIAVFIMRVRAPDLAEIDPLAAPAARTVRENSGTTGPGPTIEV
jgi:hypothetical protein